MTSGAEIDEQTKEWLMKECYHLEADASLTDFEIGMREEAIKKTQLELQRLELELQQWDESFLYAEHVHNTCKSLSKKHCKKNKKNKK